MILCNKSNLLKFFKTLHFPLIYLLKLYDNNYNYFNYSKMPLSVLGKWLTPVISYNFWEE